MRYIKKGGATYHCMSRTIQGRAMLGRGEQEVLRKMIWRLADFSGLKIITYCIMSNHFHVLVEVPEEVEVSDDELVRRFRVLYPLPSKHQELRAEDVAHLLAENGEVGQALRQSLLNRMGDLSIFMKALKQRYSVWYNRTHETYGAFWSERFKSVLVEGRAFALQAVAAYIDLNPVRAGIVKDPKDYRFCGYAEALAGRQPAAEAGVRKIMQAFQKAEIRTAEALPGYREILFDRASQAVTGKAGISREKALRVIEKERGALSLPSVLRCRLRYISEGLAIGSEAFLRELMKDPRCALTRSGRKRKLRQAQGHSLSGLRIISGRVEDTTDEG